MPAIDYAAELNEEQLAVVRGGDGPCLVLAGAGSGKTRTIVYRVAYLIESGVRPEDILLLTFTNKAADEMMARISSLLGGRGGGAVFGGTFHSVANRLLRAYGSALGYAPNFTILDQDDGKALIKTAIRECGIDAGPKKFPSPSIIQEIQSYARNAMRPVSEVAGRKYPGLERHADNIGRVLDLYKSKKKAANAMDFDDLLEKFHELLAADPALGERIRSRFRHIMVDEYQDTNRLQAAIVKLLTGAERNVLVVGDDAQSIYSFRAADIRNILEFTRDYPEAKIFRLETNYRSTPEILALANDVIAQNTNQYPKELKSVRAPFQKPLVAPAASAASEAAFVARKIGDLVAQGVRPEEIAVLFRATFHSQALEFELMKRGLSYDYRGGLKFFDRAHVKDALALLRIACNFADEAAWMRLLGIQAGIGETTAAKIFAMMRESGSLARALVTPVEAAIGNRAAGGWRDMRLMLESLHRSGVRPDEVLRKAVIESPYADYLEREYPNYRERLDDLEQLANFAAGYDSVAEFLAEVTLNDSLAAGRGRSFGPKIVLSTVHQAKGLEWDSVFVIHLTDAGFPNKRAAFEDGGLEEERRLFYVAVTRARRHLFLSYPALAGFGGGELAGPSMFLSEAHPATLDRSLCEPGLDGADPGYDEPAVVVDADDPFGAIKARMRGVRDNW